jgi:hypothetical protein
MLVRALCAGCLIASTVFVAIPASATLSGQDQEFLRSALRIELGAYDLSLLATRKASGGSSRALAQRLSVESTGAYDALKTVAHKVGEPIPAAPDLRISAQYGDLINRSRDDFDQSFVHDIMIDADIALDTFDDEAAHGNDAQLRSFAASQAAQMRAAAKAAEGLGG